MFLAIIFVVPAYLSSAQECGRFHRLTGCWKLSNPEAYVDISCDGLWREVPFQAQESPVALNVDAKTPGYFCSDDVEHSRSHNSIRLRLRKNTDTCQWNSTGGPFLIMPESGLYKQQVFSIAADTSMEHCREACCHFSQCQSWFFWLHGKLCYMSFSNEWVDEGEGIQDVGWLAGFKSGIRDPNRSSAEDNARSCVSHHTSTDQIRTHAEVGSRLDAGHCSCMQDCWQVAMAKWQGNVHFTGFGLLEAKFKHYYKPHGCGVYCNFKAETSVTLVAVAIVLFSAAVGAATMGLSRVLGLSSRTSYVLALAALLASLSCGFLPVLTKFPIGCTVVQHPQWRRHSAYPLAACALCVSVSGWIIGTACLWHCPEKHGSSRIRTMAVVYLSLAVVVNLIGVIANLFVNCAQPFNVSTVLESIWTLWPFGSCLTNIILQKLVLMRMEFVNVSSLTSMNIARKMWRAEACLIVLIFIVGLCTGVARVSLSRVHRRTFISAANYVIALSAGTFVVSDGVFSFAVSSMILHSFRMARERLSPAGAQGDAVAIPNLMKRTLFLAKLNVFLVVTSVVTTSCCYVSFAVQALYQARHGAALEDLTWRASMYVALVSLVMDSLSNDVCALFIGFGPIGEALDTLGSVVTAETIGIPTMSRVSSGSQDEVVGSVLPTVAPSATDMTTGDIQRNGIRSIKATL